MISTVSVSQFRRPALLVCRGDGGGSKSVIAGYETQLDERRRLKVAFDFGDCIIEAVELGKSR